MAVKLASSSSRRCAALFLFCLAALLCLWSTPAAAQPPASLLAPRFESRSFKPIFWAEGITQINQLDDYARAGFNTVVIRLFWQPTRDGSIVASDLEPQRAFAAAAQKQKLDVIYALPPAPYSTETTFSYSGEAGPYRVMWENWTQRAISQLRDTPNLIGWMLPDDPRALPFLNETSFSRWLAANYGNLSVLNSQWNTRFQSIEDVTIAGTRQIIENWRGPVLPSGAMTDEQGRAYIRRAQNRKPAENFAFHPAALALAHYQWDAYRGLLDFWAKTIRAADPNRKIFSGTLPDYAQLLSLPASVDVSVPSAMPGLLEPDMATHNPHAVDLARRGGRFQAVPVLSTNLPNTPDAAIARLVPSWMDASLAHGASGIAFDSWPKIFQNGNLRRVIASSFARLQGAEYSSLWGQAPAATTAVILTPLADGVTLRFRGQNAPLAALPNEQAGSTPTARGVYGFGEDMIPGEPSALTYALRWGTAFGSVDFLSPDELGGGYSSEKFGLLKRYGAVLLPQALSISPGMAQELASYVASGGVIVTDLGVGAQQNGGRTIGLPPELTAMLGVVPTSMHTVAFNLQPGQAHPLLPTWATQIAMKAKILTAGAGPDGAAFAGPVAFGELLPGTVPLALAFDLTQKLPGRNPRDPRDDIIKVNRSWLTLRPFGQGSAIFAPFRLWSLWYPGHPGFDAFHGDLFARNFALTQPGTPALTSTPAGTPTGNVLFCETVNFPNAIVLLNHNAAPNAPYGGGTSALPATPKPQSEPTPQPTPEPIPQPAIQPAPDESTPPVPAITAQGSMAPGLAKPADPNSNSAPESSEQAPVVLTPEELEALFGKPAVPSAGSTPGTTPSTPPAPGANSGAITPDTNAAAPAPAIVPVPQNPTQPAVVHTSGAEYFLWRNALCVFPVGPAPNATPGRSAPLPTSSSEFVVGSIVRPPLFHPVVLYAHVPAMEMKVLRAVPVRVQNVQGGALAANVLEYSEEKVGLQIWPNSDSAFLRGEQWRLAPGKEGKVRITLFDGETENTYRVAPGSRHRVSIVERSLEEGNRVLSTTNYQLAADSQGRLNFELTGTSIGVEIAPLK